MVYIPPRNRVLEYSTSNSQSVFAVTGAADPSYNAFSAFMAVGDTTIGGVVEQGVAFKSGILTCTGSNQLTLSTVFESKGVFSAAGSKQVFMGLPAQSALNLDGPQTLSAAKKTFGQTNLGVREVLTATRVYYVNPTTGNNSNNGLSPSTPFLTIQKAADVCQTLDFAGNAVFIQLAAGTYTGTVSFSAPTLGGNITVQGDNTTPSNVVLDGGAGYPFTVSNHGTVVNVSGVKVKSTGASGFAANNGGRIYIVSRVEWGQCSVCMSVDGGFITNFANAAGAGTHCWITGNFSYFARATNGGKISQNNCTFSIPAGTTCSQAFLSAATNAIVEAVGNTWTVANVTGVKYTADTGGGVQTFGSGASSVPGTVAGTATSPGFFS